MDPEILLRLTVPHDDINGVLASVPRGDARRELERHVAAFTGAMGRPGQGFDIPEEAVQEYGPYFYVHVYLETLPHARAYHRERGVPDEISWATLRDLGRHMAIYRRRHDAPGLNAPWWPQLHFRGMLYQLGRLQFERAELGETIAAGIKDLPHRAGDPVLSVHIPDFLGPMSPRACDDSFARAKAFFAAHFPEEEHSLAVCFSWLLDRQLGAYLPGSNIAAFQDRFREAYSVPGNGLIPFIYGRDLPPDELPRRTALEKAVADHLAAGGSWHLTAGYAPL
ncbi:acyltransferase domain-containing protein [Nonomuraea sp. NPDC050663]|uniref:acyltransferase domain-containing protein n=1 Tax=Nonomuraea sp. NPDC050663 TaxID=3364370 RepID=UPI0037905B3C